LDPEVVVVVRRSAILLCPRCQEPAQSLSQCKLTRSSLPIYRTSCWWLFLPPRRPISDTCAVPLLAKLPGFALAVSDVMVGSVVWRCCSLGIQSNRLSDSSLRLFLTLYSRTSRHRVIIAYAAARPGAPSEPLTTGALSLIVGVRRDGRSTKGPTASVVVEACGKTGVRFCV
jgi:hypothetical protein